VDPAASKRLFDDEVAEMRARARFVETWAIISATYPDLVVELPHPSGARRRFRFRCDEWDDQAPSVKSVDANGNELANEPVGPLFMGLNTGYGLCAPGTREYHDHHKENPWPNQSLSLAQIVVRVASHYRRSAG
jgi:hypothetical protein